MNTALEPKLTAFDKRVLEVIEPVEGWRPPENAPTVWVLGERLAHLDLEELERILNGLLDLGYIMCSPFHRHHRRVYFRTRKGDEAVR